MKKLLKNFKNLHMDVAAGPMLLVFGGMALIFIVIIAIVICFVIGIIKSIAKKNKEKNTTSCYKTDSENEDKAE